MNFGKKEKLQPGITNPVIFFNKFQPKSNKVVAQEKPFRHLLGRRVTQKEKGRYG